MDRVDEGESKVSSERVARRAKNLKRCSSIFALLSPWILYWTLSHHHVDIAALTLFAWLILRSAPIFFLMRGGDLWVALRLPLLGAIFTLMGLIFRDERLLLVLPAANQFAFAATFFASLRGTPLVERYARMSRPDLPSHHLSYCRRLTQIWAVYLFLLACLNLIFAFFADLSTWTFFSGLGSYFLMALLFTVEYVVRKIRFREFGTHLIDRYLRRILETYVFCSS